MLSLPEVDVTYPMDWSTPCLYGEYSQTRLAVSAVAFEIAKVHANQIMCYSVSAKKALDWHTYT